MPRLPNGETPQSILAAYELARGDKGKQALLMKRLHFTNWGSVRTLMTNLRRIPEPDVFREPISPSLEDHIKAFKQSDSIVDFHQRVPFEWVFKIDTDLPVAVCNTADWQGGQHGVDYDQFAADHRAWLETQRLYLMVGGDCYQNIIQPAKMGSSHNQQQISAQRGFYVQSVKPIHEVGRLIAIGTGNHNYWTALLTGEDWDMEFARRLGVAYTKHAAIIHIQVGEMDYPFLRLHQGRFNSSFNLTHTCKQHQRIDFPEARVVVVEHQHQPAMETYWYNQKQCVAIRTGTYAVYDDRALQYGFFGSRVSNPTVVLYPHEDKIVPFLNQYDAINYLKLDANEILVKELKDK